jgi:antitoxin VapB
MDITLSKNTINPGQNVSEIFPPRRASLEAVKTVDRPDPKVYIFRIYYERGSVKIARLFRNGQSQAVRLPKDFRFEGDFVYVKRSGNAVVLLPAKGVWSALVESLEMFSDDFMAERSQPESQKREHL